MTKTAKVLCALYRELDCAVVNAVEVRPFYNENRAVIYHSTISVSLIKSYLSTYYKRHFHLSFIVKFAFSLFDS